MSATGHFHAQVFAGIEWGLLAESYRLPNKPTAQEETTMTTPLTAEQAAELERLRADARLYRAVERAAKELPAGWEIEINIMQGSAGVILSDEFGFDVEFPTNHERLDEEVDDALEAAIAAERKGAE
jgi:hypothetical protein